MPTFSSISKIKDTEVCDRVLEEETLKERLRMRGDLLLLFPKRVNRRKTVSTADRREMNLEEVKAIIQGKGLITVVKRDSKTSNRKKVFNTLTKCKIKVTKLQNVNSFGSIITTLFYLPMATNIIPSK